MAIADFCASPVSSFVIDLYILVLPFYVHLLGCMPISAHSGLFKAGALFIHLYIPPGPGQGLSQRTCSVNVPFVQSKKYLLPQMFNDHQFNNHQTYNASCFFDLMGACSLRIVFLMGSCKNKEFYFVFQKLILYSF